MPQRPSKETSAPAGVPSGQERTLSSEDYRDLVENLSEGVYRSTPQGKILLANQALADMLGYTVDELQRKDIACDVYLDPGDRDQNLGALAVRGSISHYGLRLRKKNGDVIVVEESSRAVCDPQGQVLYYEGIIEDVTDRHRSEQEAKHFRDLFQSAIENVSDGVVHLSLDGRVEYVNSVIETNTALRRDQIIGKHFLDVWPNPPSLPHEKYHTWADAFQAVVETRQPVLLSNYPIRYRNPLNSRETAFTLRIMPQVVDGQLRGATAFVEYFTEQLRLQEQILQSEARYRNLVENAAEAIFTVDMNGHFVSVNRSFERITGRSHETLIGYSLWDAHVVAPEFVDLVRFQFRTKLEGAPGNTYEIEIVNEAGERIPIEITTQLLYVEGRLAGVLGIGRDIRKRKELERELLATRNQLQSIFDNALDGIIAIDAAGDVVGWNRGAEEIFQLKREAIVGQPIGMLFPEDQHFQFYRARRSLMVGEPVSDLEIAWRKPDGKLLHLNVSVSPIRDDKGKIQGASAIARDITERKKMEVTLQHLVITDYLTETYNRYYFDQLLEKELSRSQRSGESLSVVLIDIDGFKEINDSHGHLVGDRVLKESARILKSSIRNSDTLVRYGGDEFLILLPETNHWEIQHVVRRLEGKLYQWNENETFLDVPLGFSIGYATCAEGKDFEKCVKIADRLMYENKNRRKG